MAVEEREIASEADYARCAEITRHSSSNFYYAFMLLPAERRRALYAVYAFCRFVDDIADDGAAAQPALLLERWRLELRNVYSGTVERPVSRALADNVRRFNIPQRYFEEVIDGVEMDLTRKRYATFAELGLYCRRVASAVGLICIEIFGYRNPATRVYAERLGLAFQLTNIIRDVREDAERDRIYLPREDLQRFGVSEQEILQSAYTPGFSQLMEFEAARARQFYQRAASGPCAGRPVRDGRGGRHAADLYRIARADQPVGLSRVRPASECFRAPQAAAGGTRLGRNAFRARELSGWR